MHIILVPLFQDYHEYRFDWLPGSVKFYVDSVFVREMTTNVPNSPGRILLNHWTDGNPYFSGGPPTENADLRVSHLNMFFNSSEAKQPPVCLKSEVPCSISGKRRKREKSLNEKKETMAIDLFF